MPNLENRILNFPTLPITFICDNIREPGNLGSILRIAAAIPVQRVVLLQGIPYINHLINVCTLSK